MSGRAGETSSFGDMTFPENPASRQVGNVISHKGGAMRAPLRRVLTDPKGHACLLIYSASSRRPIPAGLRLTCSP